MIRPVRFGFNEQTAESNAFQDATFGQNSQAQTQELALEEFDTFVAQLQGHGINVSIIQDTPDPHTPDSIFPNNWVSFHNNGTVVLYPMQAENRRLERRNDVLTMLSKHFYINRTIDLTHFEAEGKYLEGTGSMVLDRQHHVAYACVSPRTHTEVLDEFAQQMNYTVVKFRAVDANRQDIYHTNVMMCIATHFAVVCTEAIPDLDERLRVIQSLEHSNKRMVEISLEQMNHFAGNMLEVKNGNGSEVLVMSTQAYNSLTASQIDILDDYCTILHSNLNVIEGNGGGSARCMMAEVHLPKI